MYIFKELLGLRSEYDIKMSKQELEEIRRRSEIDLDCEWKKLKPRSMRNQILMNFAVSEARLHGLGPKEAKHLYHTIQLGFQFKKLTSDDVNYEKGNVTSISGLEWDEETQGYILTNPQKSLARTDKPASRSNYLNQAVDRWIRDYKANYILSF